MLLVVKYGGNAMSSGDDDPLLDDIAARAAAGDRVVLVHGGGPQIDAELARRSIVPARIDGLRVTDALTLELTEAVLCGSVNKALVRALVRRGASAVGISGQDGSLLVARKLVLPSGADLGFVGAIAEIRPAVLDGLLTAGFLPVVSPLAIAADATCSYNVNADTAAGAIAGALRADAYVVVTNVQMVRRDLDDPASGIARLDASEARALLDDGTFSGGMRPKMLSALDALAAGALSVVVCGSGPGGLAAALAGNGTVIVNG